MFWIKNCFFSIFVGLNFLISNNISCAYFKASKLGIELQICLNLVKTTIRYMGFMWTKTAWFKNFLNSIVYSLNVIADFFSACTFT